MAHHCFTIHPINYIYQHLLHWDAISAGLPCTSTPWSHSPFGRFLQYQALPFSNIPTCSWLLYNLIAGWPFHCPPYPVTRNIDNMNPEKILPGRDHIKVGLCLQSNIGDWTPTFTEYGHTDHPLTPPWHMQAEQLIQDNFQLPSKK